MRAWGLLFLLYVRWSAQTGSIKVAAPNFGIPNYIAIHPKTNRSDYVAFTQTKNLIYVVELNNQFNRAFTLFQTLIPPSLLPLCFLCALRVSPSSPANFSLSDDKKFGYNSGTVQLQRERAGSRCKSLTSTGRRRCKLP